ncbi:ATP-binding protein [Actinoplanes sp. NPDC049599]|uniref:ATP-binding protein n=1 Tax=Actinoplanes sp. NPDC049599 TaxID=3363903 RepID=UPI003791E9F5
MTEVGPPYMFRDDDLSGCFGVSCDVDTGMVEMAVRGKFSLRLSVELYAGFRKCLAEHPAAMVVDLSRFEDPYAVSAAMWLAAHRSAAGMYPPVRLALTLAPTAPLAGRLRRLGTTRLFPVFATVAEARAAMAGPTPLTERLHLANLPPEASSVEVACELVDIACASWHMPELQTPSREIMSELVRNAVEHAGTELSAAVWRRGPGLHLSVRDRDPGLPSLREPTADNRGWGLRMVDGKSAAWGAMATHDGKMVWATLRTRRQLPS